MKNNMTIGNYLFQPFRFFAGKESLLAGLFVLVALTLLSYRSSTFLDGVLDVHYECLDHPASLLTSAVYVFVSWAITVLVFFITAKILSKSSIRLIDMAGTMAVAKSPLLVAVLIGFIPSMHLCLDVINGMDVEAIMVIFQENLLWLSIGGFVCVLLAVWSIFLMYNAYAVSGNLKGTKGIVSFIVSLLIAEIISKIVFGLVM
jgi:hypothetical protein